MDVGVCLSTAHYLLEFVQNLVLLVHRHLGVSHDVHEQHIGHLHRRGCGGGLIGNGCQSGLLLNESTLTQRGCKENQWVGWPSEPGSREKTVRAGRRFHNVHSFYPCHFGEVLPTVAGSYVIEIDKQQARRGGPGRWATQLLLCWRLVQAPLRCPLTGASERGISSLWFLKLTIVALPVSLIHFAGERF